MVHGKLITQGISTNITILHTFASVQCSSGDAHSITVKLQRDSKISHIFYVTSFGLIVGVHLFLI